MPKDQTPKPKLVKTYTYVDEQGNYAFEILRYDPKDFRVRHKDKQGRFVPKKPATIYPYRLFEMLRADKKTIVFIVEGEKDVDTLYAHSLVGTTNPFGQGEGKFQEQWASYFQGRRVVIIPDADKVGIAHAERIERIVYQSARAAAILTLDLPSGKKDVSDWFSVKGNDGKKLLNMAEDVLVDAELVPMPVNGYAQNGYTPGDAYEGIGRMSSADSDEEIEVYNARLPFTPFPLECLPSVVRDYVRAGAEALNVDPTYIALPALVALGGAIGDARAMQLKETWIEPSVFWGVLIAGSTTLKSSAQLLGVGPLKNIQAKLWKEFDTALGRYEVSMDEWKASGGKAPGKGRYASATPPRRPDPERLIVQDVTIEKLADILRMNPRGVILVRDELAAWFSSFARYKQAGGGSDLPNWLEIFQAHEITIDRKTGDRPTIHVPRALVSIIGTIQPTTLSRALGEEHFSCGLASRFLLAMPPKRKKVWTEAVIPEKTSRYFADVFQGLFFRLGEERNRDISWPKLVTFTPDGKAAWVDFYNRWGGRQDECEGDQAYALGKLEAYCARFALLLCVIDHLRGDIAEEAVTERHVQCAEKLVIWFAKEVDRVYALIKSPSERQSDEQVLDFIASIGGAITPRRLLRSNGAKYRTSVACRMLLDTFVEKEYGVWEWRQEKDAPGARATRHFVLTEFAGPGLNQ